MARKKIKEGSNVNIVNTIDSVTDIINKILTNIKEESYKVLTKSKDLSYKDKMKLRNNIYVTLSVLKALDNMYVYENESILDSDTYTRACLVFKELKYKKLADLLKDGRNSSIDACHDFSFEIMRELDKVDYAFTTQTITIEPSEDGREKYSLVKTEKVKVDNKLIHLIKKLIRNRNYLKTEQYKNAQSKISTQFFSTDELNERLDEVLDFYKGAEFKEVFTPNMIRYIMETLTIRFNILHNSETTPQQKNTQTREFQKIINNMGTTAFVNSGSELFDAKYDYTVLLHVYHKLEHALSTNEHSKKLVILKELDGIIYKLDKHAEKALKAFKKCLNKTNLKELEEKLKGYQFIDDEEVVEESEQTNETTLVELDDNTQTETITESVENIEIVEETKPATAQKESESKTVNSRTFRHKAVENIENDLPELYTDGEQVTVTEKTDERLNSIFSSLQALHTHDDSTATPSVDDINETVNENVANTQTADPSVPNTKYKLASVDSISERLNKLNRLLNKNNK